MNPPCALLAMQQAFELLLHLSYLLYIIYNTQHIFCQAKIIYFFVSLAKNML